MKETRNIPEGALLLQIVIPRMLVHEKMLTKLLRLSPVLQLISIDRLWQAWSWMHERLFIVQDLLKHMKCTEAEGKKTAVYAQLDHFNGWIEHIYFNTVSARNFEVIWNGGLHYSNPDAKYRFKGITQYLRFDKISTRTAKFETEKFFLWSEKWHTFKENFQNLFMETV